MWSQVHNCCPQIKINLGLGLLTHQIPLGTGLGPGTLFAEGGTISTPSRSEPILSFPAESEDTFGAFQITVCALGGGLIAQIHKCCPQVAVPPHPSEINKWSTENPQLRGGWLLMAVSHGDHQMDKRALAFTTMSQREEPPAEAAHQPPRVLSSASITMDLDGPESDVVLGTEVEPLIGEYGEDECADRMPAPPEDATEAQRQEAAAKATKLGFMYLIRGRERMLRDDEKMELRYYTDLMSKPTDHASFVRCRDCALNDKKWRDDDKLLMVAWAMLFRVGKRGDSDPSPDQRAYAQIFVDEHSGREELKMAAQKQKGSMDVDAQVNNAVLHPKVPMDVDGQDSALERAAKQLNMDVPDMDAHNMDVHDMDDSFNMAVDSNVDGQEGESKEDRMALVRIGLHRDDELAPRPRLAAAVPTNDQRRELGDKVRKVCIMYFERARRRGLRPDEKKEVDFYFSLLFRWRDSALNDVWDNDDKDALLAYAITIGVGNEGDVDVTSEQRAQVNNVWKKAEESYKQKEQKLRVTIGTDDNRDGNLSDMSPLSPLSGDEPHVPVRRTTTPRKKVGHLRTLESDMLTLKQMLVYVEITRKGSAPQLIAAGQSSNVAQAGSDDEDDEEFPDPDPFSDGEIDPSREVLPPRETAPASDATPDQWRVYRQRVSVDLREVLMRAYMRNLTLEESEELDFYLEELVEHDKLKDFERLVKLAKKGCITPTDMMDVKAMAATSGGQGPRPPTDPTLIEACPELVQRSDDMGTDTTMTPRWLRDVAQLAERRKTGVLIHELPVFFIDEKERGKTKAPSQYDQHGCVTEFLRKTPTEATLGSTGKNNITVALLVVYLDNQLGLTMAERLEKDMHCNVLIIVHAPPKSKRGGTSAGKELLVWDPNIVASDKRKTEARELLTSRTRSVVKNGKTIANVRYKAMWANDPVKGGNSGYCLQMCLEKILQVAIYGLDVTRREDNNRVVEIGGFRCVKDN
ncbi:hypothetical protein B0H16DRAFT_1705874 [Mycena metata]|uniref:Uncharacterized protein n=1 Tax=Mycena metata TaxID=1033252 RepID=A0AAD7DT70_9AGAR|nr:hypothetical protein B0H16DRAFT_1705874 [Mycena metata]